MLLRFQNSERADASPDGAILLHQLRKHNLTSTGSGQSDSQGLEGVGAVRDVSDYFPKGDCFVSDRWNNARDKPAASLRGAEDTPNAPVNCP
jgi:hypothetical protein